MEAHRDMLPAPARFAMRRWRSLSPRIALVAGPAIEPQQAEEVRAAYAARANW